jgi:hypothetical protein
MIHFSFKVVLSILAGCSLLKSPLSLNFAIKQTHNNGYTCIENMYVLICSLKELKITKQKYELLLLRVLSLP